MKNARKLCAVLAALMLAVMTAVPAMAADSAVTDPALFRYEQAEDGGARIIEYTGEGIADIVIPDTLGDMPVTEIGRRAFADETLYEGDPKDKHPNPADNPYWFCAPRYDIVSVTFPNSLRVIGESAFEACNAIRSIQFPEGLEEVGPMAFLTCFGLESVTFPSTLRIIRERAFQSTVLTSLVLPEGLREIESYAFGNLYSLTSAQFPQTLETIGDAAFASCVQLSAADLPESLQSLGTAVFAATALQSLEIPGTLKTLPAGLVMNCGQLRSVSIPSSVTAIEQNAFGGCDALTQVSYGGTEAQWKALERAEGNEPLESASVHCASVPPVPADLPDGIALKDGSPVQIFLSGESYMACGYHAASQKTAVPASTLMNQFMLPPGATLAMFGADGEGRDAADVLSTGDLLRFRDAGGQILTEVTAVVQGDVLGTGIMGLSQLVRIAQAFRGDQPLTGPYLMAADFGADGVISLSDLVAEARLFRSET